VLHAVSEIAGPMSVQVAAHLLESSSGGRGILLGGAPGIAPATIVILGAGVVGVHAAGAALAAGAEVTVLDRDVTKLRGVCRRFPSRVTTMLADRFHVRRAVEFADVLIGAVLIRGDRTPHLVSEEMIRSMKPGSVAIDVSIDQGGCFETSQPTSILHPTYVRHDVVHYAVPNMTAAVARTATYALSHSALPFVVEIAERGFADAVSAHPGLRRGLVTSHGACFHPPAAHRFQVPLEDPLQVVLGMREAH
jgi:alanine dehydrogenase